MAWYEASAHLLQATKAGRSPWNNDEVSMYNLTVFQIFYWRVGKVWKLIPLKKGFILQSKGAHFEKFAAALRAAKLFYIFPPRFARYNMASTLQICFLRLCL